jgi:hypothetical protein
VLLLLPRIDDDLAAHVRSAGCAVCGGRLDAADYPRKPRGADEHDDNYARRRSFCCAAEGCRRRATPPSVRFLGRKVYVGAVVVLAAALQHGPTKKRVAELAALLGATRRTLVRWRRWWSTMFTRRGLAPFFEKSQKSRSCQRAANRKGHRFQWPVSAS